MLTNKQIESFKNDGILILRNFFTKEEIKIWNNEVHDYYHNPKTAMDWKSSIIKYPSSSFTFKEEPHPSIHVKMNSLYTSLNNEIKWEGDSELVARRPEIDAEWLGARTPHLDFPLYAKIRTLANSVFYLNDVSEKGGPFMYWKGSHKVAWEYFKSTPQDYMAKGDLSQGQIFEKLTDSMENKPVTFHGEAGDLLIWHSLLLHSPSVNLSNDARLAVIGRWGKEIKEGELRFDFSKSMWENWAFRELASCV